MFGDFVKVCRSLELFGRELIAVDGTRIKAVNRRDRKLHRGQAAARAGGEPGTAGAVPAADG